MLIVLIGVIRDAVEEGFCSTTTIFIMFVAGVFVVSALLHPKVRRFSYLIQSKPETIKVNVIKLNRRKKDAR